MVINYLKWAYGGDPVDMENFRSCCSIPQRKGVILSHDYPHMKDLSMQWPRTKVLHSLAILLNESQPDLSPERIEGTL